VKNLASLTGFYDDLIIDNAEMAWFWVTLCFVDVLQRSLCASDAIAPVAAWFKTVLQRVYIMTFNAHFGNYIQTVSSCRPDNK